MIARINIILPLIMIITNRTFQEFCFSSSSLRFASSPRTKAVLSRKMPTAYCSAGRAPGRNYHIAVVASGSTTYVNSTGVRATFVHHSFERRIDFRVRGAETRGICGSHSHRAVSVSGP